MQLILAGPPVALPSEVTSRWEAITVEWVGADGSRWNLADGTEGVALQAYGTEGMHDPILTKFSSKSRAIAGKRPRGWRAEERPVFWPVLVYTDNSDQWVDTYDRFFASIHPDVPGTWRVGFKGQVRELEATGVYDRGHTFDTHPTVLGWGKFGITLEAVDPWWRGEKVVAGPWKTPDPVDFFGGGTAPAFNISESAAFGSATINNPGDIDEYLTWVISDALTEITVGVGGKVITVPFDVDAGEMLRIDTDPRNPTALLGPIPPLDADGQPMPFEGVDVTEDLGLQPFAVIGRGMSQELHVEATGSGQISAELTPHYFRAIGRRSRGA